MQIRNYINYKNIEQNCDFKYVYNKFESSWYYDRNVETIIKKYHFCVKEHLEELEHSSLITERIYNMETAVYLEQLKTISIREEINRLHI